MIRRTSIALIGVLLTFTSIVFIEPATAAPCTPSSSTNGNSTVLRFTTVGSCTWSIPAGVTALSILVVAGGGGGGGDAAGGGGAGGVYMDTSVAVTPSTTKNIQVGGGGTGGQCSTGNAGECASPPLATAGYINSTNGGASIFDAITVPGGGRGGVYNNGSGGSGGSGGGGGASSGPGGAATATGTFFYGSAGGAANGTGGGGGGGAGQTGTTGGPGNGGNGIASAITGTLTFYAGGGGGGGAGVRGTGGNGGGGAGAESCSYPYSLGTNSRQAIAGSPNTGGGGGGAPYGCAGSGGNGGSGVVIISYINIPTIISIQLSSGLNTAIFNQANTIRVTLSLNGRVKVFVNGKALPGCANVLSVSAVASCTWKPSNRGVVNVSSRVIGGTSSASLMVGISPRTTKR